MNFPSFPWLELTLLLPILGASSSLSSGRLRLRRAGALAFC